MDIQNSLDEKIEKFGYDPTQKREELGSYRVKTFQGIQNFELTYLPSEKNVEIRHQGCNGLFKTYSPKTAKITSRDRNELMIKETLETLGIPLGRIPDTQRYGQKADFESLSNPTGQ